MRGIEEIIKLMSEVGEIEDFCLVVEFSGHLAWQIIISENSAPITLEIDDVRCVVILSSEIGEPESEQINDLNLLALEYSHHPADTGGGRISRSTANSCYNLIADHGLATLTRETLGGILRRFGQQVEGWRTVVAGQVAIWDEEGEDIRGFSSPTLRV
jgi:hypothetical protein